MTFFFAMQPKIGIASVEVPKATELLSVAFLHLTC